MIAELYYKNNLNIYITNALALRKYGTLPLSQWLFFLKSILIIINPVYL